MGWAFDLDVLRCPRCAGRMELIVTIDDPAVIHRILAHLALPSARNDPEPAAAVCPPARRAARASLRTLVVMLLARRPGRSSALSHRRPWCPRHTGRFHLTTPPASGSIAARWQGVVRAVL